MKKIAIILSLAALLCGCTTTSTQPYRPMSYSTNIMPDEDDMLGGTGIESGDIRTVARRMAESILGIYEISESTERQRIALLPVKNETRFIINQDIFTKKIRIELNKNARGKVRFLARDRMEAILTERDAKSEGLYTSTGGGKVKGADYFLTGELTGLAKARGGNRSDYILMSFQLIETDTSEIIWEDAYEIKKVGMSGVAYQ